jgi:hypothetical protein
MELLKSITGSVVRKLLTGLGVVLVERGWISGDDWNLLLGGTIAVAAAVMWGIWEKYKSRLGFLTALNLPAGSTPEDVKAMSKRGNQSVWSIIALLILIPMALGSSACSDDQKIKTEDAVRKIYIGLQGASSAIEEVNRAGKIDDAAALGGYKALNQVGLSVKLFKERVRSLDTITVENKVQLIPLLDSLISDIDKARTAGLLNIPREQVASIEIYYEMAKSGALTLKAVVNAVKKPVKIGNLPAFSN